MTSLEASLPVQLIIFLITSVQEAERKIEYVLPQQQISFLCQSPSSFLMCFRRAICFSPPDRLFNYSTPLRPPTLHQMNQSPLKSTYSNSKTYYLFVYQPRNRCKVALQAYEGKSREASHVDFAPRNVNCTFGGEELTAVTFLSSTSWENSIFLFKKIWTIWKHLGKGYKITLALNSSVSSCFSQNVYCSYTTFYYMARAVNGQFQVRK